MRTNQTKDTRQKGFTLTELMIALVLGLLVAAAAGVIFLQSKRNYLQNEQISRVQENGRYALKTLVRDISMAGFLGEHLDATTITTTATVNNDCQPGGGSGSWFATLNPMLELVDGSTTTVTDTFGCLDPDPDETNSYRASTDAIAIKRVADAYRGRIVPDDPAEACGAGATPLGCTADDSCCIETGCTVPAACTPQQNITYLQTNRNDGFIYHRGAAAPAGQLAPMFEDWRLLTRVYFIRPHSVPGDGAPTLCRMVIQNTPSGISMIPECLAEGVENMQIEIGVDPDGDGVPNYFTPTPDNVEMQQAVSAQIYLLVRGSAELASFNNNKEYRLGSTTIPAANDGFYRRVFSTTVHLRNFAD